MKALMLSLCLGLAPLISPVFAEESVRQVSAKIIEAQGLLSTGKPAEALRTLKAYLEKAEEVDPLAHALIGLAHYAQEEYQKSVEAHRQALALEPGLDTAAQGLIQALVQLGNWAEVQMTCGQLITAPEAKPQFLLLAIDAAGQEDDHLLALYLARQGAARFPQEDAFRLRWAVSASRTGFDQEARAAWEWVAFRNPVDPDPWRALAALHNRGDQMAESRQALAIALALTPEDEELLRQALALDLAAGFKEEAFNKAHTLANASDIEPPSLALDDGILVAQAADMAGEQQQGLKWLDWVDEILRDESWHRQRLRLAVAGEDIVTANEAIQALLASGEDPDLRLWAAELARQAGDHIAVESHLLVCASADPATYPKQVHLARLHLARLYIHQDRLDEAVNQARAALATKPDDPVAQQLLTLALK